MHVFGKLLMGVVLLVLGAGSVSAQYVDLEGSEEYGRAIERLTAAGVVSGYGDGTFRPGQEVNRAEFLKIVVSTSLPSDQMGSCVRGGYARTTFYDVGMNMWYWPYICAATDRRLAEPLVGGYGDGNFRPEQGITLVEAAKILAIANDYHEQRYAGATATWFEPYVRWLGDQGAIPHGVERWDRPLTRGEVAEIVGRLRYGWRSNGSWDYAVFARGNGHATWEHWSSLYGNTPSYQPASWDALQLYAHNERITVNNEDPGKDRCRDIGVGYEYYSGLYDVTLPDGIDIRIGNLQFAEGRVEKQLVYYTWQGEEYREGVLVVTQEGGCGQLALQAHYFQTPEDGMSALYHSLSWWDGESSKGSETLIVDTVMQGEMGIITINYDEEMGESWWRIWVYEKDKGMILVEEDRVSSMDEEDGRITALEGLLETALQGSVRKSPQWTGTVVPSPWEFTIEYDEEEGELYRERLEDTCTDQQGIIHGGDFRISMNGATYRQSYNEYSYYIPYEVRIPREHYFVLDTTPGERVILVMIPQKTPCSLATGEGDYWEPAPLWYVYFEKEGQVLRWVVEEWDELWEEEEITSITVSMVDGLLTFDTVVSMGTLQFEGRSRMTYENNRFTIADQWIRKAQGDHWVQMEEQPTQTILPVQVYSNW